MAAFVGWLSLMATRAKPSCVDQARQFLGRRVDGDRLVEGARRERCLAPMKVLASAGRHGGHVQGPGDLVDDRGASSRQFLAATDPGARCETEPGTEVLRTREDGEVGTDLRGNRQGGGGPDGRDPGEINPHHPVQRMSQRRVLVRGRFAAALVVVSDLPGLGIERRRQAVDHRCDLSLTGIELGGEKSWRYNACFRAKRYSSRQVPSRLATIISTLALIRPSRNEASR